MFINRFRQEQGFTLIELLVVILVIGILLAIALPAFLNQQNKAKDSEAKQSLSVGYKVAKAEQTNNDGNFPSIEAVRAAIGSSEPQLGGVLSTASTAPVASEMTEKRLYVASPTGSGALKLAFKASSGTVHTLTVTGSGAPSYTP